MENSVPLHKRIYLDLLQSIQQGDLRPGELIPTEKELQERYSVSRAPVRQALARLEKDGYVLRTPGRGTEVTHPQIASWARLSGFAHFYSRMAERLTSRTVSVETIEADAEVAEHLGLEPGGLVLKVTRLRLVEGRATACIHTFITSELGVEVPDYGEGHQTLQQLIRLTTARDEVEVQEDLRAVGAPSEVASLLGLEVGAPVLFVARRGWDRNRSPVEFSRYWARTEEMFYRTTLNSQ